MYLSTLSETAAGFDVIIASNFLLKTLWVIDTEQFDFQRLVLSLPVDIRREFVPIESGNFEILY